MSSLGHVPSRYAAVAVLVLLSPSGLVAEAAQGPDERPSGIDLPAHGPAAVRSLGAGLTAAAERNGMTGPELRRLLLSDRTAWVDGTGQLYYVDPPTRAEAGPAAPPAAEAPYPLADTFLLHSRAGSTHKLYLDFTGALVSGTAWNQPPPTGHSLPAATYPAWSLDGDPATFSDVERSVVQEVWQRVAEDFAPFDLDVTTQDPGLAALVRSSSLDQAFGTTALISPSQTAEDTLCPTGCSGVGYVDVFDEVTPAAEHRPVWVFPHQTDGSAKHLAEVVSHEVGHNFSLHHDGINANQYYGGHGVWAPLMGAGYAKPVTQWSRGEYAGATNPGEDDVALIASHGAPLVADDAGGTIPSATAFAPGPWMIGSAADQDVFALGTCAGSVSVRTLAVGPGANLDVRLEVLDGAGTVHGSSDPPATFVSQTEASGLAGALVGTLSSGQYYARVDGVGVATPSTGYSDYGSLGAYRLAATGCGLSLPGSPGKSKARSGRLGGRATAKVTWQAPGTTGGTALTGYRVLAHRLNERGKVVRTSTSKLLPPGRTKFTFKTRKDGRFRFAVQAVTAVGAGPAGPRSRTVRVR
jgi:hypothetical protein